MKKSVVINSIPSTNLYGIVVKTWETDQDGNEINVNVIHKTNQTWDEVLVIVNSL